MFRSKKFTALLLAAIMLCALLAGCTNTPVAQPTAEPVAEDTVAPVEPTEEPVEEEPEATVEPEVEVGNALPEMPNNPYPFVYRNTDTSITSLNPHRVTGSSDYNALGYISDCLLGIVYNKEIKNWNFVPIHAEALPTTTDNIVWTFKLRDGITFADGKPIDAYTYLESWKLLLDPVLANVQADCFYLDLPVKNAQEYFEGTVKDFADVGLKALDAKTLEVTLANAMPPVDVYNEFTIFQLAPVDIELYNSLMTEDKTSTEYGVDFTKVAYSGAYTIEDMNADQFVHYVRNPKSIRARYYTVDRIEVTVSAEATTNIQLFEDGKIDVVGVSSQFETYKDDPRVYFSPAATIWGTFINTDPDKVSNKIFLDADFRKALFLAVDRTAIAKGIFNTYTPANFYIGETALTGDPLAGEVIPYRSTPQAKEVEKLLPMIDKEQAKTLFDKAYEANGGKPVTMDIIYFEGQSTMKSTAEALQQMFEETFGADKITVTLTSMNPNAAYDKYGAHDYDLGIGARGQGAFNPWAALAPYRSDYSPEDKADFFYNEAFDELQKRSAQGDLAFETDKRTQALADLEKMLMEYIPFLPIFGNANAFAIADRVTLVSDNGFIPGLGWGWLQADYEELK